MKDGIHPNYRDVCFVDLTNGFKFVTRSVVQSKETIKMDEGIYEELKGTGNCEIHLDRRMAEKRVYPSILINKSGTRREELLLKPEILQKTWILRKLLYNMDEIEAMEFVLDKMKQSKNNLDFFDMMRRGG